MALPSLIWENKLILNKNVKWETPIRHAQRQKMPRNVTKADFGR